MADILIVEGYACVRDLLKEELTLAGYTVHAPADISSIHELVSASWPDLVILDIYHERAERWDLLHAIKKQARNLPVIIFTAHDGYRNDPRSALAEGFVTKSVFFDKLLDRLKEILKRRSGFERGF